MAVSGPGTVLFEGAQGPFDAVAARYAIEAAGGADCLALTHVDRLPQLPARICTRYSAGRTGEPIGASDTLDHLSVEAIPDLARQQRLTDLLCQCQPVYENVPSSRVEMMLARIAQEAGVPIGITSAGPSAVDKQVTMAGL